MTLNNELARIEIDSCLNNLRIKIEDIAKYNKSYSRFESSLAVLNQKERNLIAEQANIKIAVNTINNYLQAIFFSSNRLQIEELNGKYVLKVNGLRVSPKNISTGERNIIALCYFFTTLGEGLVQSERYTSPNFIVIDDPISSFDLDNKLGLINFLRIEIQKILELSSFKSRVILLTHDLQVIFDLARFLKKVGSYEILYKELSKALLCPCNLSTKNEYTTLLKEVYQFASNEDINEFRVGNTLRRILEFYCSFLYKIGIEKLLDNDSILGKIEDDNRKEFFKRSIYKIVLNGYSHTQDSARSITITDPLYSVDECRKITRSVLGLMYSLDPEHVLAHLCDGNNEVNREPINSTITSWIDEFICEST